MKNLLTIMVLYLLLTISQAWSLPKCSGSYWDNCYGTWTYDSGDKYVGEWKDDKRNGQGTFTWADGDEYVGEWKDEMYHGQGTMTWADGMKYVGEYKDSKRNGQGTFTFADGNKYVGEWKDDNYHGQGTFTYAGGEVWQGQWENDEWVSGEKYATREAKLKAERRIKLKEEFKAKLKAEREAKLKAEEELKKQKEDALVKQRTLELENELKAEREAKLQAEREAKMKPERRAQLEAERRAQLEAEREAKLRAEEIKNNPGFRNIKPGMTEEKIKNEAECNIKFRWSICYNIDNLKFYGNYSDKYLEELYIDLGPLVETYSLSNTFAEILGEEPSNIYEKTLQSLNKKYTMEYSYNERERQLFNENMIDQLLVVFNEGQVALKILRKKIDDYNSSLWLFVEYRGSKSSKLFLEANRPTRETSDDF